MKEMFERSKDLQLAINAFHASIVSMIMLLADRCNLSAEQTIEMQNDLSRYRKALDFLINRAFAEGASHGADNVLEMMNERLPESKR